jgi:hypothetical protein
LKLARIASIYKIWAGLRLVRFWLESSDFSFGLDLLEGRTVSKQLEVFGGNLPMTIDVPSIGGDACPNFLRKGEGR